MRLTFRFFSLMAMSSLMLGGCLGGGGDGAAAVSTASASTSSDFFQLAIVPDQTVNTATFTVQVVAENIDPTTLPGAPVVVDHSGASHTMALTTLKWPGTAVDSVTVYSAAVPLAANQVNNLKAVSGTKELPFSIRHKAALSISTATNGADLVAKVRAAMIDPSIDVVEIDYNEPDLGLAINDAGNGVTSVRTTWLTVKPAAARTVAWARNTGAALARPKVDFLNIDQVTFGSNASDGAGGQFYLEDGKNAWLSNVEFRGQYKFTWPKGTPMTANYLPDVRQDVTKGLKVYFTDCLWDGTASSTATSGAQLARDLRFNSHRGDINNFGKVFLNAIAQDIVTIRNAANTDFLHNDGFQVFNNTGTSELIFKGLKITSPNIGADLQPFLLDKTMAAAPSYSGILLDSVTIAGAVTTLKAQLAGNIANSRISNFSFPSQSLTIRQDFSGVDIPFGPTNVRIHNFDVLAVEYYPPVGPGTTYTSISVPDPNNISSQLNAVPGVVGATFSNIKLN